MVRLFLYFFCKIMISSFLYSFSYSVKKAGVYEQYHPQAGPQALYRYQDEEKMYAWQKANKRDCFGVDRSGK
ncbi:hypothetical protein EU383_14875 [Salmonella enterica subsp. enterica serovar Napoli]|nr:hypothetical protein [Salmonella enterica subsp. enterica serovar Napoli]MDN75395.1 hypothetical protein [Salmonella enterica]EBU8163549.1 hypothetical protein [Salmonella enterica subsp. enterica serovar Napoli]EBW6044271.1 hypothetical protein [Salmonella enterica subsp. enterica serovar Napoli]EBZ6207035.1 hypothetical protein [Salmonella enterica subsp. enterica serovar Napoli]